MANCYGELINCEKAVNVQFMQELVNASRVSSCVEINGGPAHSDSCASASTNDYIPTYSELSSASIAPLRVTNENPELDKNGFVYEIGIRSTSECFEGDVPQNAALKRSEISFNTTSAISNTHTVTTEPTHCDWSYEIYEYREWQRDVYKCNGDGISISPYSVTSSTTHNGKLEVTSSYTNSTSSTTIENVDYDCSINTWNFSFTPFTLSTTISADCSSACAAETLISLNEYNYGYTLLCPQIVPCVGGTFDILHINNFSEIDDCISALTLEITYTDIEDMPEDGDTWYVDGSGSVTGETVSITIPKNVTGKPSGKIKIKPYVFGNEQTEWIKELTFQRLLCEWTPKYSPSNECSVLMGDEEWIYDNEYIHNFKNN